VSTEPLSSVVSAMAAVRPPTRLLTLACSVATVLSSAAILAASMWKRTSAIAGTTKVVTEQDFDNCQLPQQITTVGRFYSIATRHHERRRQDRRTREHCRHAAGQHDQPEKHVG